MQGLYKEERDYILDLCLSKNDTSYEHVGGLDDRIKHKYLVGARLRL